MKRENKIPVTIITGFLGAGKTTFINSLLQKYYETQFALVENEFGDVAIDTKLIRGVDASQMFELKQGCICCTISDEFELVLLELAERFPDVEHLLIETTGVADPAAVLEPFFSDENLKDTYEFKGAICLVDGLNFRYQPEEEIRLKQMWVSDLILINKTENFADKQKSKLLDEIKTINPLVKVKSIAFGSAESIQLANIQTIKKNAFEFVRFRGTHSDIQSKTLSFTGGLEKDKFLRWLTYLLDIHKRDIYRVKGILRFRNEPFEFILQGIGGGYEITEGDIILNDFKSEIVFIGKLNHIDLKY